MNDRPSSGHYPHSGYDGLSTTTFAGDSGYPNGYGAGYDPQSAAPGHGQDHPADQQFGYDPYGGYAAQGGYDSGVHDASAWNGQADYLSAIPAQQAHDDTSAQWDASAWSTGYEQPAAFGHDPAQQSGHWAMPGFETGAYDATAWNSGGEPATGYDQAYGAGAPGYEPTGVFEAPAAYEATQTFDASQAYEQAYEQSYDPSHGQAYDQGYPPATEQAHPQGPGQGYEPTQTFDASALAYEATQTFDAHTFAAAPPYEVPAPHQQFQQFDPYAPQQPGYGTTPEATPDAVAFADAATMIGELDLDFPLDSEQEADARHDHGTGPDDEPGSEAPAPEIGPATAPRSARRGTPAPAPAGNRGRRRTPAKRSALLTVAVPSACVMGVAGVAAASVGGLTGQQPVEDTTSLAASDPASVKPIAVNNKLDTQLAALSADAGDFADRASRTQERIDLRERQEQDRRKRAEEAARLEALRPKFFLPVTQHGLSAGFGQSGVNWMSVHTGIDFPVSYGTPVMAATDGTVRTQWNSAYGNMAIVTSPDGTETWYCHLSSTKIRSGSVKAGQVIAYSGNSGNSTGPHLHFEVRPGGGSAINPLPWLRSHGLDPT